MFRSETIKKFVMKARLIDIQPLRDGEGCILVCELPIPKSENTLIVPPGIEILEFKYPIDEVMFRRIQEQSLNEINVTISQNIINHRFKIEYIDIPNKLECDESEIN